MSHRDLRRYMRETGVPKASCWYQPTRKPGSHGIPSSSLLLTATGCPPLRDVSQVVLAPFPDAAIEQQALMIASLCPSRFLMPTLSACSLHLYQDHF